MGRRRHDCRLSVVALSEAHRALRYVGGDKVSAVMREVDSMKGAMRDNINQAMSNLESAEDLNTKTQELTKNQQCLKNTKASLY